MNKTEKATLYSAFCYLALAVLLLCGGILDDSKGLVFGALLILARLLSEVMVFLGMRISTRRTRKFPFGLYKMENLIAALMGGILLIIAYELAKYSFYNIPRYGMKTGKPHIVIPLLAICALTAASLAFYKKRVGTERNSPGLIADARNSAADALVLCTIITGMGLEIAGVRWIEEVVVMLASIYMIWVGGGLVFYSTKVLLDASVERSILEKVKKIAGDSPLVTRVLDVKGTNSGNRHFIDLSVVLLTTDLREAKAIASDVEKRIADRIPAVEKITVQFEARAREFALFAVPVEESCDISPSFEDAPFFILVEARDDGSNLALNEKIPNPVTADSGRGVRLVVALDKLGVDRVLLRSPIAATDVRTAAEVFGISVVVDVNMDTKKKAEELVSECAASLARQK